MITQLDTINIERVKYKAVHYTGAKGRDARRKLDILDRDKCRCVTCNRSKNLTIAHIEPVGQHRNTSTYKLDNCRILCAECHIKIDHEIVNKVNYIYY